MNEPGVEPTGPEPLAGTTPDTPPTETLGQPPAPTTEGRFEQRMQTFGREVEEAAQRIGHDPEVRAGADLFGRLFGLVLVALGAWFFADYTLAMDLPHVRWNELWPIALILLGGLIVLRGAQRRA